MVFSLRFVCRVIEEENYGAGEEATLSDILRTLYKNGNYRILFFAFVLCLGKHDYSILGLAPSSSHTLSLSTPLHFLFPLLSSLLLSSPLSSSLLPRLSLFVSTLVPKKYSQSMYGCANTGHLNSLAALIGQLPGDYADEDYGEVGAILIICGFISSFLTGFLLNCSLAYRTVLKVAYVGCGKFLSAYILLLKPL